MKRLSYDGSGDNEAKHSGSGPLAMTEYGEPPVRLTAANREALLKVQWPAPFLAIPNAVRDRTIAKEQACQARQVARPWPNRNC